MSEETASPANGNNVWELPNKHLPQRGFENLPEPKPLRNYLGAGVILSLRRLVPAS